MSIRGRFIVVLVLFAVALTAAGAWVSWRHTSRALERELDEKLRLVGGAAEAVGLDGEALQYLEPVDVGSNLHSRNQHKLTALRRYVAEAFVFRRGGTLLVSTTDADSLPVGTALRRLEPYREQLDRAWMVGDATTPLFRGEDGRHYKYGFIRLQQSDAMLAVLLPADFLQPLERFQRTLLIGAGVAAILAALLAGTLATTITERLERLSRVALRIQRGHLDEPVEVTGADELGRLARAMERMRSGILERDEQLRLMLAQVAHEIRNPLGGLELFVSAAESADTPDERRRLLARIRGEIAALNHIIEDFLSFARPLHPDQAVHDVRRPLREAVELIGWEASSRDEVVEVDLPEEPVPVLADPDHVKRVVLNLLQNAMEAGSCVTLRVEVREGEVVVSVADDGPGVAEELRGRIFEPFVSQKEKGAGLGLAIVSRLTEANGGRVELVSGSGGIGVGAEFRVYFTRAEAEAAVSV